MLCKKNNASIRALTMTLGAFVVKVLGFLYKIPLSRFLGDEGMGYYNSAMTVYAVFYILTSSAIPKAFSIILTRGRIQYTKRSYKLASIAFIAIFLIAGVISGALLFYLSDKISMLMGVKDAYVAIKFVAPAIIISSGVALCRGYLLSLNKLTPVALSEVIESMLKLLCGIYFIILSEHRHLSLTQTSAFATLGVSVGAFVSFLYLIICILKGNKEHYQFGNGNFMFKGFLSSLIKITVPIAMTSLLVSFSNVIDMGLINKRLIASGVSSVDAIAQYGNYSTLVLPLFSFVSSIAAAYSLSSFPKLSKLYESKSMVKFANEANSAIPTLLSCSIFLALCFCFFGEEYFEVVFVNNNTAQGALLLRIMSPAAVFISLSTYINTVLEARGNTLAPLITLGLGILFKIPISYYTIAKFGIVGCAFSSVISYGIGFIISYYIIRKKEGIHIITIKNVLYSLIRGALPLTVSLLLKEGIKKSNTAIIYKLIPPIICGILFLLVSHFLTKIDAKNRLNSTN